MNQDLRFTINDYQKHKPFSSFLSGIAGLTGIPLWSFYVNRGQLMAGFGVRDKNGAIMEFFPANNAYHFVSRIGFRTFIKVNGTVTEFFRESNPGQTMTVSPDQVSIEETNVLIGLAVKVTYFTLPNENLAALVRKVEIRALGPDPMDVEIIDGLAQILPSGIDYGGYKAVSNLLQSWMSSYPEENFLFYKLRASTADSSEVAEVTNGNFYLVTGAEKPLYISDYKLVFAEDTSLETPYGLREHSIEELRENFQVHVNQVPCAMCGLTIQNLKSTSFSAIIGYASDKKIIEDFSQKVDGSFIDQKEAENRALHEQLMSAVETKTASPLLDAYFKQCYLDNVLRGGKPLLFDTLDGKIGYHLYSRKHGDLERDYNFFSLEPAFYSQGNGSFRDVLQNRRNDVFIQPELADFNITQFAALLQADGYNPLSIEGIQFSFAGNAAKYPSCLSKLLAKSFTPGMIATELYQQGQPIEPVLHQIISESHMQIRSSYGEGYWEDHFTYFMDLVDSYLAVYPDREEELLFKKSHPFFVSPIRVRPRSEKYVRTALGKIRQYGALEHLTGAQNGWLSKENETLKANLYGKLYTLVLNKYGHLDPEGIGLSYEADRPGWNDAMNGLPGLFGSGVSEAIELARIVRYLIHGAKSYPNQTVQLLDSTRKFAHQLQTLPNRNDQFQAWDDRMTVLEGYREGLKNETAECLMPVQACLPLLKRIETVLADGLNRVRALGPVLPTYLTFEATDYVPQLNPDGSPSIGNYGLPLVKVKGFNMKPLPIFLEAPARLLQAKLPENEAQTLAKNIQATDLYDKRFGFYQTSVSLEAFEHEIGRIRAFTPGWLERESNFLHMTYKYLLGLIKSELYDEFYRQMPSNFTCFMDPSIYGRSPFENSSFIAPSVNPDPKKQGQGFVSRLSGSTAEVLSMWRILFFGENPFVMTKQGLTFQPTPKLHHSLFQKGIVEVRLFDRTTVEYHLDLPLNTYDAGVRIERFVVQSQNEMREFRGQSISELTAQDIRAGNVLQIQVFFGIIPKEERK